ncbi:MAG: 8-oxo-dGTP diphosphatase MutT [Bacterioplanes sp.]|nr:8-oxo-dGTP diphosphatase MutT [Bacterioplanes sp.]
MKQVHVAVAVACLEQQFILLAKRPDHVHQGGLWEFPGGKVEQGEGVADALVRELAEEVALSASVAQMQPLLSIPFQYPDKHVLLDVHWLDVAMNDALLVHGAEGQEVRWVRVHELDQYAFPAANQPIIDAVYARLALR